MERWEKWTFGGAAAVGTGLGIFLATRKRAPATNQLGTGQAAFSLKTISIPQSVQAGTTILATLSVSNTGTADGTATVSGSFSGGSFAAKQVAVKAGSAQNVALTSSAVPQSAVGTSITLTFTTSSGAIAKATVKVLAACPNAIVAGPWGFSATDTGQSQAQTAIQQLQGRWGSSCPLKAAKVWKQGMNYPGYVVVAGTYDVTRAGYSMTPTQQVPVNPVSSTNPVCANLQQQIASLGQQYSSLAGPIQNEINSLQAQLNQISQQVSSLLINGGSRTTIDSLESQYTSISQRINGLQAQLNSGTLASLKQQIFSLSNQMQVAGCF